MDDVLTGEDNLIKAKDMQQQLISLFDRGGMELHKWSANNQSLLCDEMKESDYSFSKETKTLELAYGAVIYVKSINSYGGSEVKLLISKSRVAPLKFVTIPRLELCAAVLLSKLMRRVLRALKLEVSKTYFWTDSTIVLSWLEKECKDLKTFVANRISIIRTLTVAEQWNHVPSKQNPADLISRGMHPVKLQLCELWWSPSFLLQPEMTKCRDSSIETNDLYIRELKSNPSNLLSRGLKAESLLHNEGWWNGPSVLQSDELLETVSVQIQMKITYLNSNLRTLRTILC
ncbi:hypothetical protein AVEN_216664-1 [Araneus ventricosus]|uniref:Uncharacterized protein n=1 Tax=Araneus ventricosus TaxID=182803 RepID=A0A4Y2DW68_ARAVE|nr:hypothetical protein AVEN_216664-1 [Araneus ventricosus]